MDIQQLIEGKEYKLTHAYGQPDQKVKVLKVSEKTCPKWGKYWRAERWWNIPRVSHLVR